MSLADLAARRGVRVAEVLERQPRWVQDFTDLDFEWRQLFSEFFGTFLLVLVGAGGAVLQQASGGQIGQARRSPRPA